MTFECTLYSMDVSPLADTCLPEIFSQSVSLEEQRYLVLMKSDVLIFLLVIWCHVEGVFA